MVWAILAFFGVPLWLCALGIVSLVVRNRGLRKRPGDVPTRMRTAVGARWHRGHAVWVHDVFVFRGSPAAWKEELIWVTELTTRTAEHDQPKGPKGLHALGDDPVIARMLGDDGKVVEFATRAEDAVRLAGSFPTASDRPVAREHAVT